MAESGSATSGKIPPMLRAISSLSSCRPSFSQCNNLGVRYGLYSERATQLPSLGNALTIIGPVTEIQRSGRLGFSGFNRTEPAMGIQQGCNCRPNGSVPRVILFFPPKSSEFFV